MPMPIEIRFDGLAPLAFVEDAIRDEAGKVERAMRRVVECRVAISSPGVPHRRQGAGFDVSVALRLPGRGEIFVKRHVSDERERERAVAAIRDAFATARRIAKEAVLVMRGDVQPRRPVLADGIVARIDPSGAFGFIEAASGDVYFHRNSVVGPGSRRLLVGARVRFAEESGVNGPQATTVSSRSREPAEKQVTVGRSVSSYAWLSSSRRRASSASRSSRRSRFGIRPGRRPANRRAANGSGRSCSGRAQARPRESGHRWDRRASGAGPGGPRRRRSRVAARDAVAGASPSERTRGRLTVGHADAGRSPRRAPCRTRDRAALAAARIGLISFSPAGYRARAISLRSGRSDGASGPCRSRWADDPRSQARTRRGAARARAQAR